MDKKIQFTLAHGSVWNADDYLYSSARIWKRKPFDEEPLELDVRLIEWYAR